MLIIYLYRLNTWKERKRPYLFQLFYSDAHGNGQQQVIGRKTRTDLIQYELYYGRFDGQQQNVRALGHNAVVKRHRRPERLKIHKEHVLLKHLKNQLASYFVAKCKRWRFGEKKIYTQLIRPHVKINPLLDGTYRIRVISKTRLSKLVFFLNLPVERKL